MSKYILNYFIHGLLIVSFWISMSFMFITPANAESNYTAIIEIGQTPLQIGPFFGNGVTGWTWWDSDSFGNEKLKNLITLMVLNESSGVIRPVEGLSPIVDVTYPHLDLIGLTDPLNSLTSLEYSQRTQQVYLIEEIGHPGTYSGYFIYESYGDQYSGNYTVSFDSIINGKQVAATSQFQTTIYGCQKCHNKKLDNLETSFIHGELDSEQYDSCAYRCHGGSKGFYGGSPPLYGPPVNANPTQVHEVEIGHSGGFLEGSNYSQTPFNVSAHYFVDCEDCHTSFIHDNRGTDTANIANYTLYGNIINFSSDKHSNLEYKCYACHVGLNSWSQEMPIFQGTLGSYKPTFTSYFSFTDTYAINVDGTNEDGTQALEIRVIGDDITPGNVSLYLIGPINNISTGLQTPCGPSENIPCEKTQNLAEPLVMNVTYPYTGRWLAKLTKLQEGTINYTIVSNYPMAINPIITIPECNDCHNQDSLPEEKKYSKYAIPDWNPGFAHADINGDGTLDIQCRMCHDSMHDINVKTCQYCHGVVPANHPIAEPYFSQYNQTQCLSCHGDTHNVTRGGGPDCISCHDNGGISTKHVNVNILNNSVHRNLNFDVIVPPGLRTDNRVCWGCHQSDGTQPGDHPDRTTNPYGCIDCHGRDNDIQPPHIRSGYTIYTNPARKIGQEIVDGYNIGPASTGQNMTHNKDTIVGNNFIDNNADYPDKLFYSRHSNPYAPGGVPGAAGNDRNPNYVCLNCHTKIVRDAGMSKENQWQYPFCTSCHQIWGGLRKLVSSHELSLIKCTDCHSQAVGMSGANYNPPNFHYYFNGLIPPDNYTHVVDIGSKINSSVHGSLVNDTTTGLPVNSKGCLICHTDANYTIDYNGEAVEIIINEGSRPHVWNSEPYCTSCHALTGEQSLSGPTLPSHSFTSLAKNNNSICLECHGGQDKHGHTVTSVDGTICITCHSQDVNISLFGRHADINASDGAGNVTNNDCWTCHYQKNMNRSNVYLCESCHSNGSGIVGVNDPFLIKSGFMHGMTSCKTCHASTSYHQQGMVGPLGTVENVLRKIS